MSSAANACCCSTRLWRQAERRWSEGIGSGWFGAISWAGAALVVGLALMARQRHRVWAHGGNSCESCIPRSCVGCTAAVRGGWSFDAAQRDGKRFEHKNAVLQEVTGRRLSHAVGGADPFVHLEEGCAWGQRVIGFVSGLINALETHARANGLCVFANASGSCVGTSRLRICLCCLRGQGKTCGQTLESLCGKAFCFWQTCPECHGAIS